MERNFGCKITDYSALVAGQGIRKSRTSIRIAVRQKMKNTISISVLCSYFAVVSFMQSRSGMGAAGLLS
jgi:hypothetical protein